MSDKPSPKPHAPIGWFKSSFSSPSQSCVEILFDGLVVHVRDSKYRHDPANPPAHVPTITITGEQWTAFLDELTDQATTSVNGALSINTAPQRSTALRDIENDTTLTCTEQKWEMFRTGVRAHDVDDPNLAVSAS